MSFESRFKRAEDAIASGASLADVVGGLKAQGATIIEAMKVVRLVGCMSLGEAKNIVASHPAWTETVIKNEPLYRTALAVFSESADDMSED